MPLAPTTNGLVAGALGDVVNLPLYQSDGITPFDCTGNTGISVYFQNPAKVITPAPSGQVVLTQQQVTNTAGVTLLTWVASVTTAAAFSFATAGTWEAQSQVTFSATNVAKGRTVTFTVERSLA